MTSRDKVYSVLKSIKQESEINAYPEWVEFRFNLGVFGIDILSADEERRILMKVEKEGLIEIHLPEGRDEQEESYLSGFYPKEFMMDSNMIMIKILPAFYQRYFFYSTISLVENKWNYVNPFWLLYTTIKMFCFFIAWLWKKSKPITIALGIIGSLFVYDWSLAWRNIKVIIDFLRNL